MGLRVPVVYRSRNFQRLWFSTVVSKAGSNLTEIALAVFAFRVSGGQPEAYAGVLVLDLLPALVLGWAVGGVVDRWNRKHTMVAGDIIRALLVTSVPFVGHLWWAYVVVFTSKSIGLIYTPNQRAILPETVGSGTVMQANAAIGAATNLVDIPAYVLGVALLLRVGIRPTFLGDGFSYLLAGLALAGLALPRAVVQPTGSGAASSFAQTLREGIAYYRHHRLVLKFLWLALIGATGVEGFNVLSAALVRYQLHRPEGDLGWLLAALAVGGWLGSTLLGRLLEHRTHYPWTIGGGFIAVGVSCLGLAWSRSLLGDSALFVLVGLGAAAFLYPTATWIQSIVPAEMRGRVYAARGIVIGVAGALSVLGAGVLAQHVGVGFGFLCLAVILILTGFLTTWSLRADAQSETVVAAIGTAAKS